MVVADVKRDADGGAPHTPPGVVASILGWARAIGLGVAAFLVAPPVVLVLAAGRALAHVPTIAAASLAAAAALQGVGGASPPASQVAMTTVACATVVLLVAVARGQRVALDGHERTPLSVTAAAAVAAPAVVLSVVLAGTAPWAAAGSSGSAVARGLVAACVLGPALTAAAVARVWRGRPSLEAAIALEAAVLHTALAGTGITFTQRTVAGMHTVAFAAPAATAGGGAAAVGAADAAAAALPPLLLLHGYGSGSALWLQNIAPLVQGYGGPVFLCDWRGCACSPRVAWPSGASPPVAEAFFLDALDAWRVAGGFERLALVGHSLGGYLAAAYYLRHGAERVAGLFLVSPAGLPLAPPPPPRGKGPEFSGGMVRSGGAAAPGPRRVPWLLWQAVSRLWDAGVTPGSGVRALGPLGPLCARSAMRGRASRWVLARPFPRGALRALGEYLFHTHGVTPSGERALSALLMPGAFARDALLPRLRDALAASTAGGAAASAEGIIPVTLWYGGSHDWMSAPAGDEAAALFVAAGFPAKVVRLPRSGHHCYLEATDAFNESLLAAVALVR